MANLFAAQGYPMGDSLVDAEALDTAREILQGSGTRLRLPVDVVIADGFDDNAARRVMDVGPVPEGWRIMDIGPETVAAYAKVVIGAGTVVWNGPMGVFEMPNFAVGTFGVAKAVAESSAFQLLVAAIGFGTNALALAIRLHISPRAEAPLWRCWKG
jgi:phosphoglycerate kinase